MTIRHVLSAFCILLLSLPATAQENRFLDLPTEVLAETWLTRNCGIEEERLLEIAIARRGEALEPLFIRAWREGPGNEQVKAAQESAAARFRRNQAVLQDPESLGLSGDDLARAKATTEESYVTRVIDNQDLSYRGQALRGLSLAGGDEGRQIVEGIAADSESPFNSTAAVALESADDEE